jgi:hypothetical protein
MTHAPADASDPSEAELAEARPRGAHGLDELALSELLALSDTHTLLLTDGAGEARYLYTRDARRDDLAEIVDISLSAVARAGDELGFGQPVLVATRYARGSVVAAVSPAHCVVVLSTADANLGQLFLLLRQLVAPP